MNKQIKIGVLGGTFDPVHNGHLYLAKKVLKKLSLDKIIFIPTYIPPHKKGSSVTSARHRYNMLKFALKGNKKFSVSCIELNRKGKSYSIDTIRQLRKKYKNAELYFITGSDSLKVLKIWKALGKMLKLCTFIIVKRPGHSLKGLPKGFIALDIKAKDISSTELRKRFKKTLSIAKFVPKSVRSYITNNSLYKLR
ncbi:MAG: nicotinate-nucleotide adenylyltransferase [Candidatus Omnitrophota bacterium]